MSLYLMPHRGASLSTWSFGDGTPQFDLSGEYFVFYSHGLDAPTWTFWFEIQVKEQAVLPWRSARPGPSRKLNRVSFAKRFFSLPRLPPCVPDVALADQRLDSAGD